MHCGWVFHIFGSLFCWGGGVVGEVGGKLITYPSLGKTNSLTNYFSSVWLTRENRKENIEQNNFLLFGLIEEVRYTFIIPFITMRSLK